MNLKQAQLENAATVIKISYPLPLLHTSIDEDVFYQFIHLDRTSAEGHRAFLYDLNYYLLLLEPLHPYSFHLHK